MEKLPKPLIALITTIIDEYENFTWNSIYLGDKMRVSLVWTRGDLAQINKGVKHKSKSCRQRDNKRLKVWQKSVTANAGNVSEDDTDEHEQSENSETIDISDNETISDAEMVTPKVTSQQVNITPVVSQPIRQVSIDNGHNSGHLNETKIATSKQTGRKSIKVNNNSKNETSSAVVNYDKDEPKILAPRSIVTGKSPCLDTHFEKVVFSRTSKGDYIIGKVKMRDIIVFRNMSLREPLKHIGKTDNNIEYTELSARSSKYKDVRKLNNDEYDQNVNEIPEMERYVEKFTLCPYCFKC